MKAVFCKLELDIELHPNTFDDMLPVLDNAMQAVEKSGGYGVYVAGGDLERQVNRLYIAFATDGRPDNVILKAVGLLGSMGLLSPKTAGISYTTDKHAPLADDVMKMVQALGAEIDWLND